MIKAVSIVVPSIRPQNLIKFYTALTKACSRYSFELIIPSPYLIPEELMKTGNVIFLHTYTNPTISFQLGAKLAQGDFIYNTTDDGLIQPDAIDYAISLFLNNKNFSNKTMLNMTYEEGVLDPHTLEPLTQSNSFHPPQYWMAYYHPDLRMEGIHPSWKICPHFLMKTDYFIELGGFDCQFEYNNHALHDLAFRAQANVSEVIPLPKTMYKCSHLPERTGDHGPIHDAQTGPDLKYFNSIYSQKDIAYSRIKLDIDNWKKYPSIWERRFNKNNLPLCPN